MHRIALWSCLALLIICLRASGNKTSDVISAPRKLSSKAVSPASVRVKWRDPDLKDEGQGERRMYAVRYGSSVSTDPFQTVYTPHRRLTLFNLAPGVEYDVTIRTITSKTKGPWSEVLKVKIDEKESSQNVLLKRLRAKVVSATSIILSWQVQSQQSEQIDHITVMTELPQGDRRMVRARLAGTTQSYTVKGLKPDTKFVFTVQTTTKFGRTDEVKVIARTKNNAPAKPPRSLRLRVLNSTVLSIRWQAPPLRSRRGSLTGYKIQYKPQGAKKEDIVTIATSQNIRVYRLEEMQKGQGYKVRVAAVNKGGDGPFTKWKSIAFKRQNGKNGEKKGRKKKDRSNPKDKKGAGANGRKGGKKDGVEKSRDGTTGGHAGNTGRGASEGPATQPPVSLEFSRTTGLTPGAKTAEPEGDTSPETTVRLPSPPLDIYLVKVTATTLHLAWQVPASPACCTVLAYGVEVRNLNDSSVKTTVVGDPNVVHKGLEPETHYSVQVTTINTVGRSAPSQVAIFQTAKAVAPVITEARVSRAVLGREVNLTCQAVGEEPASFRWLLRDGGAFINVSDASWVNLARRAVATSSVLDPTTSTSSLWLYSVTRDAQRDFACVAVNSAGSDQRTIAVVIEEPPSILSTRGMHVMVGTAAQLECVVKGRPLPEVTWIHDVTDTVYKERDERNRAVSNYVSSVTEGDTTRRSFLVIERTALTQEGAYRCLASSDLGVQEAAVELSVLVPPPPPVRKIQAIPLSPGRVSVSWLPPLNYSYAVRYYQVSVRDSEGGQPGIIQTTRVGAELSKLHPNSTYFVGVTAATEHGLGESGPEVRVTTLSNIGLEPANLSVASINSSSLEVTWKQPGSVRPMYIRGYNVYTRPWKNQQLKRYFVQGHNTERFTIELGQANQYDLRMSTLTTWGFEAFTPWRTVMKPKRKVPPKPVRDFSAASVTTDSFLIKWRDPRVIIDPNVHTGSNQVLAYMVGYQAAGRPRNVTTLEIGANKRLYQLKGLDPNTMYSVHIKAIGLFGTSEAAYLNVKTAALPPSMVQNASALPISSTKIHIRWAAPHRGPITRYHIRYWRPGHKDKQSAWMAGNYRNYIAGSLRKNSNYRFEIIPYNGDLLGEGIVIFSKTYSDKPDRPPKDVKIMAVDATTMIASWTPPDPETTNGKVTGYRLVLKGKDGQRVANFQVDGTQRNFTFLNMPVSSGYKFRMATVNANGTGVFSQVVDISYNQEPRVPASPEKVRINASATALTLQWDEPKFTGSPTLGYIVGYGQFIPDVFRRVLDNTQMTFTINLLKPNSEYIVSVRAFNSIGESAPSFRLTRTKPLPAKLLPLQSPLKLTALAGSPTSLSLSWVDPTLAKLPSLGDKRFYQIRYSSIDGEAYSFVNTSSTTLLLQGLQTSTIYETSVRVIRGNETSDWSLPAVNSTQQLIPEGPPTAIKMASIPGRPTLLHLNWSEPEKPNGLIEMYVIYLSHDPTLDPSQWVIMETHRRQVTIRDLTPYIPYYLKLQARNKAGYGPLSPLLVHTPPRDRTSQPSIISVSGLYGNESTTTEVRWEAPEVPLEPITGYMLYYIKSDDNPYGEWMMQSERGTDDVILGLDFNATYFLKVRARYLERSGPFSEVVNYTTPEGSETARSDDDVSSTRPEVVRHNNDGTTHGKYVRDDMSATGTRMNGLEVRNTRRPQIPVDEDRSQDSRVRDESTSDDSNNDKDDVDSTTTLDASSSSSSSISSSSSHRKLSKINTDDEGNAEDTQTDDIIIPRADGKKIRTTKGPRKTAGNKRSNRKGRKRLTKKRDKNRKRKSRRNKKKRKRDKKRRNGRRRTSFVKASPQPTTIPALYRSTDKLDLPVSSTSNSYSYSTPSKETIQPLLVVTDPNTSSSPPETSTGDRSLKSGVENADDRKSPTVDSNR